MRDVQPGMNDYTDILETYCANERIGRDNVAAYKGILESGTWYFEDHLQISGANGGNTSAGGNTSTSDNTGSDPVTPTLKTVTLTYSGSFAGGIAGINAGTIKCSQAVTGRDISAEGHNDPNQPSQQLNASTGGIAGCNYNGALINQCYFGGDLNGSIAGRTGGWCIGGIAGMNCRATISNCYAYNNFINCHAGSGGVVGVNDDGTLVNCLSSTYSLWYHDFVCLGETAGMNAGGGTITNCYYDNANGAGAYMDYDSDCEGGGIGIDLYAASSIPGFDESIWDIQAGSLPTLKNAAEF